MRPPMVSLDMPKYAGCLISFRGRFRSECAFHALTRLHAHRTRFGTSTCCKAALGVRCLRVTSCGDMRCAA